MRALFLIKIKDSNMKSLSSSSLLFILLSMLVVSGCDTVTFDNQHLDAGNEGNIDALTEEALAEAERLTQSFNKLVASSDKNAVYVPAGSENALADALLKAGPGGKVILASGAHYESQTVVISERVTLVGQEGATLIVDTNPRPAVSTIDPALHIQDASHVSIIGVEIQPAGDAGGTAILAQRSSNLVVANSQMTNHQVGVAIEFSNNVQIIKNTFAMTEASGSEAKQGVVVINGKNPLIALNTVFNATVGLFASDSNGRLIKNVTYNNLVGIILCKFPGFPAPDGEFLSAEHSATSWVVALNNAHSNAWGYLVIDGASDNTLARTNIASNNSFYDIELAGDTERFGFFSPTSFQNKVFVNNDNTSVKDCGVDNLIVGGEMIDTAIDPCF
ncbi:MAG: right-handed parallel beta-helix repeat-containing protein [Rhodothermales bacterium]